MVGKGTCLRAVFLRKTRQKGCFWAKSSQKSRGSKAEGIKKRRMRTTPHLKMRKIASETRIRRICSLFYGKSAIDRRATWGSTRVRYACVQNITAPHQNIGAVPLGAKKFEAQKNSAPCKLHGAEALHLLRSHLVLFQKVKFRSPLEPFPAEDRADN